MRPDSQSQRIQSAPPNSCHPHSLRPCAESFGTELALSDQLFFDQVRETSVANEQLPGGHGQQHRKLRASIQQTARKPVY